MHAILNLHCKNVRGGKEATICVDIEADYHLVKQKVFKCTGLSHNSHR